MRLKWMINSLIIVLFCSAALFGLARRDSAAAAGDGSEKIETTLLDQIRTDGSADFIVRFTEQPDLSAAYSMDWDARGEFVYNTLRDSAKRSQSNAKVTLDAQGLTYQTLIAGNELYVWGGSQATTFRVNQLAEITALNALAALPEVNHIRATRTYTIDPITDAKPLEKVNWAGDLLAEHGLTTVGDSTITATLDWGITDTKANQFWTTFGVAGDGIVLASIDTGVQWNHPALDQAFKCGTNPSDPKCWADPANICGGSACDNNGHGTHTMGTMVGDDDPSLQYNVGMAPNAKWIACKGCETSTCSEFALTTCADWILAPGGDPANRPNIVNNSWGDVGGNAWYMTYVNNWRAAGIFPAFSAGNKTGCPVPGVEGSMGSPGDYQESFASTGHDINRIHYFAQGPSFFGDSPYTKPNISAPGVNIWSAYPTTKFPSTWALMSGTSMASPHTAGAVALLWSCNSSLKGQIDETFQLLQNSADATPPGTCGSPADGEGNYTYGYGYLDVLAAGKAICPIDVIKLDATLPISNTTTISFTIRNVGASPLDWKISEIPRMDSLGNFTRSNPGIIQGSTNLDLTSIPVASLPTTREIASQYNGLLSVLYDQTDNPGTSSVTSQDFEASLDAFDSQGADDFTIPEGDVAWSIRLIDVMGSKSGSDAIPFANVYFYTDNAGVPGVKVYSEVGIVPQDNGAGDLTIALPIPAILPAGHYWLSVQADMDYGTDKKQWFWNTRSIATADPYEWVNPGDGFQTGCSTWSPGKICFGDGADIDSLYRMVGTIVNDIPWLSENPISGTIPAGESVIVDVTFDSTGLTPGVYLASLVIRSNNPNEGLITIPVTLNVPGVYLPIVCK